MRSSRGITFIELMLVLVLAGAMMMLGIQQYQSYRFDASFSQIKANIDLIALATARYFYANCAAPLNAADQPIAKKFYINQPLASLPYPDLSNGGKGVSIDLQNDLIQGGFLSANELINVPQISGNYVIQMNLIQQDRMVCMTSTCLAANGEQRKIGTINQWSIQISVSPTDSTQVQAYSQLLGASCVSHALTEGTTTLIQPCTTDVTPTKDDIYIVFQRSPSFPTEKTPSDMEAMTPTVQQFQQMYTTLPITRLLNEPDLVKTQFFNCAG